MNRRAFFSLFAALPLAARLITGSSDRAVEPEEEQPMTLSEAMVARDMRYQEMLSRKTAEMWQDAYDRIEAYTLHHYRLEEGAL